MIDKVKTESKKYCFIHGKIKDDKEDNDDIKKQIQIEKIKKVFRDTDLNEKKNNDENEKINQQIYNLNFNSKNIETFKNFSLVKNTIGTEKLELKFQNVKEKLYPSKKNNNYNILKEKNNIIKNDNLNNNQESSNLKEKNIDNNIKNELDNELEIKNDLKENLMNVTHEQMKIFDNGANKLYNDHKNNLKLKIFQINHPYLHNIKLINNKVKSTSSSMTKEQRLLPILQKQNSILKKIQENNISRSNSSLGKNVNDSIAYSISNRDNKSDKVFSKRNSNKNNNLELYPPFIGRSLDINNNILENYSTSDNGKNNSTGKINLIKQKNINFKPYTLEQYKNKYENNNNIRVFLGGLGPNLGSEEWNKKHKMAERKKHYADYIKEDFEFNLQNKKPIKLKNKKNEDSKTVTSKKDSEFSSYETKNGHKYKIFKTENNMIKNYGIKLTLINKRFKNNNKIKLKKNKK